MSDEYRGRAGTVADSGVAPRFDYEKVAATLDALAMAGAGFGLVVAGSALAGLSASGRWFWCALVLSLVAVVLQMRYLVVVVDERRGREVLHRVRAELATNPAHVGDKDNREATSAGKAKINPGQLIDAIRALERQRRFRKRWTAWLVLGLFTAGSGGAVFVYGRDVEEGERANGAKELEKWCVASDQRWRGWAGTSGLWPSESNPVGPRFGVENRVKSEA